MKSNKKKVKKKFVAIGKIGNNPDGTAQCVKHWTNSVEKWMNKQAVKFPFLWINFYYNTGTNKGRQFMSWTKNKGYFNV